MVQKIGVLRSVFSLNLLFDGCELAECWRDTPNDNTTDEVPADNKSWSFPSNQLGKFLGEKNDVEHWLRHVQVEARESLSPLFGVLSESLIWVADSRVQVADFVIEHVL